MSPPVARPITIEMGEDQISIVQFWRVLKRRWLVLGTLGAMVLLVLAASLILPNVTKPRLGFCWIWKATTTSVWSRW